LSDKLRRRDLVILFALGLTLALGVSLVQRVPGYTDAEYYYSGGVRLYEGKGFTEMILWNYLDDPEGLPHPSHAYWMPLPSIVAAAGMFLLQNPSFFAGRLFFFLLSAIIPPLTALLSQQLGQNKRGAFLAGLLALFSGFYLNFSTLTEGFSLVMVFGADFFLVAFGKPNGKKQNPVWFLIPGAIAGLMHLTRADGFLWLVAGLAALTWALRSERKLSVGKMIAAATCLFVGYLAVMGPWFMRNLSVVGSMMPPGGSRGFWLSEYNEIFSYPAEKLSLEAWIASGWQTIINDRLGALWSNLKTAFAVQGAIFLFPLMLAGLWKLRQERRVVLGAGLWLVILGVMSFVFPYAGARGGFLHSGAALQPLLWASVPFGLDDFVAWGSRLRSNWDKHIAGRVFGVGVVLLSVLLSSVLFSSRVVGGSIQHPVWEATWERQFLYEAGLVYQGAGAADVVMINNPAGLYAATRRAAIVTPNGGPETAVAVAQRYGASFLILEVDHVDGLEELYESPRDVNGLRFVAEIQDAYLFEFVSE
jgi:hypothetical protein